jgi:hypothetical protein
VWDPARAGEQAEEFGLHRGKRMRRTAPATCNVSSSSLRPRKQSGKVKRSCEAHEGRMWSLCGGIRGEGGAEACLEQASSGVVGSGLRRAIANQHLMF